MAALPAALEWQALIVGAGPEERRLRMLVDKFRLSGRIAIKTDADDAALAAEYPRAGVFVRTFSPALTKFTGFYRLQHEQT